MSTADIPQNTRVGQPTLTRERHLRERPPAIDSPELRLCISHYKPVSKLRPQHRQRILEIISYWQGYDGKIARCEYENCPDPRTPVSIKSGMDVDHGHPDRINEIRYLFAMHHSCNASEYQQRRKASPKMDSPTIPERARTGRADMDSDAQASSSETERHAEMRPLWDLWISDKESGAFSKKKEWYKSSLAETAVHALILSDGSKGSSVTYRRFIREDIAGGVLELHHDERDRPYLTYLGKPCVYRYNPKGSATKPGEVAAN